MPVATRSCSKQKRRPRIEDETPATTKTNRSCRYVTRSTTKRKILQQNNVVKDLEPLPKRAATITTSKKATRSTSNPSSQERTNTTINKDTKGGHGKTSKCRSSRIPKGTVKDNKKVSSFSNKEHQNKENHNEGQTVEKSQTCMSPLNPTHNGNETIAKTPADCIAARIRSFSALRRSQWRKNNKGCSISNNENPRTSPIDARSPLAEVSSNPTAMEIDADSDEDILWKMSTYCSPGEKEDLQDSNSDDEISYKKKYFTMMTAMKQLQNTFLRAQQNAERNVKAYDKFSDELKSSLSIEKQKNSLLSEELKIKKGTVERLRSDLESVKEQLEHMKEDKMNIEKHNQENHEKETNLHNETTAGQNETLNVLTQQIEDQKRVINFYSQLTGVSISRDHICEDSSSFQSFNCTFFPAANSSHCLQFRLTHDKEFDEIEYIPNPRSPGAEDVVLSLPKYLQENIFFGADQAPRFLAKFLKTTE